MYLFIELDTDWLDRVQCINSYIPHLWDVGIAPGPTKLCLALCLSSPIHVPPCSVFQCIFTNYIRTYTHTHTHTHIYIYIYVCVQPCITMTSLATMGRETHGKHTLRYNKLRSTSVCWCAAQICTLHEGNPCRNTTTLTTYILIVH